MKQKNEQSTSYNQRIIYLKHGVKQGNPNNASRCNAKAKSTGQQCRAPAMRGKLKCRLHGGKSTGAKTVEGLKRCRRANWKHGNYSAESKQMYRLLKVFLRENEKYLSF